jgi:hypothetical protein
MRRFHVLCGCIVLTSWTFLFESYLVGQSGDGVRRLDDKVFVPIFDGKTFKGWHLSGRTVHGRGGRWDVKDGAIVGCQDFRGDGGVLMTDALYGNYEIALEMNNNFGSDSGLFLRSTEEGCAYQALIDYHGGKIHGWNWDGSLMGIFGERLWRQERPDPRFYGGDPYLYNFVFGEDPSKIRPREGVRLPVSPEEWPRFWKHGEWNELRARITGEPPTIATWIKGVKWMEFTYDKPCYGTYTTAAGDLKVKRMPEKGHIGLQVHGGGDMTKLFVRYRNIRVKQLD